MKSSIVGRSNRELHLNDALDKTLKIQALRPSIHVDVYVIPDAPPATVSIHHALVREWNKLDVLKQFEILRKKHGKLLEIPHAGWRGRMQQGMHKRALQQLNREADDLLRLLVKTDRVEITNEPDLLVQKAKLKLTVASLIGAGYFYYE